MSFVEKNKPLLIGVAVALGLYILYYITQNKSCGCGSENFGPKYKKPERFTHNSRAYEMGPERFTHNSRANEMGPERFNMDFTAETSSPPMQSMASAESPFIGTL